MKPRLPQNPPEYVQVCLQALADQGLGNYLSLGGAFGLMHYQVFSFLLDSFEDLVANKMIALVERCAPRDFLDIYRLCAESLVTPSRCWLLWSKRQHLAGSDTDNARERLAVLTHLARIEQHRPMENTTDDFARAEAERVRTWFKEVFVDVLS